MAEKNALYTHPLTPHILPGITRKVIIEICRERGLTVHETFFSKERLLAADEVFLTGTMAEAMPVTRVDDRIIGDGRPGALTKLMHQDLLKRMDAEA